MRTGISTQAKDGVGLLEMGLLRDAIRAFGKGLQDDPDDLECLLGMSRALMAVGQERGAIPLLQRFLRLRPNHPEVVSHLARMRAERGDAKALDTLRILSAHPKAGYFEHFNYGDALLKLGTLDEAEAAMRLALEADPESPYPHVSLGIIAQRRGHTDAALESFREAAGLDEKQSYPLLLIARAQVVHGDIKAAIEALNEGLRRDPRADLLHVERIKLCLAVGATDQALKAAELFRQLFPKSPEATYLHGLAALTASQGELARSALEAAIELAPQAFEPRLTLARLEQIAKNVPRERELLEQAVQVAPEATPPALDLSNFYLRHGEEAEAEKLLRSALARDGRNPALHLNLALALAKTDVDGAVEHARQAQQAETAGIREQAERLVARLTGS